MAALDELLELEDSDDHDLRLKLLLTSEILDALADDDDDGGSDSDDEYDKELEDAICILLFAVLAGKEVKAAARRATRRYLTREDLLSQGQITPWTALYSNRNDRSFITTLGIDVPTFDFIINNGFARHWREKTIGRTDVETTGKTRPGRRLLDAAGGLGLVLHWLSSTTRQTSLQLIFALTTSSCHRYLSFALEILHYTLLRLPEASIHWPTPAQMEEYSKLIVGKHGDMLKGGIGFVDGLNLPIQVSPDDQTQNSYYNAWLHTHLVSSVLAFAPTGKFTI
jgi:hypothetical protein